MNSLLKLEEIAFFILSIYFFSLLDFAWWWFPVLLLTPDISMLGYLVNPKIGAWIYNLFHHKMMAVLVSLVGFYLGNEYWLLAAVILFAHISMDRIFGFGLKYEDDFKHTHLGKMK